MLDKCANPACLARFHYMHEGRVYLSHAPAPGAEHDDWAHPPSEQVRVFWLCGQCARVFKLVEADHGRMSLVLLRPELKAAPGEPREAA